MSPSELAAAFRDGRFQGPQGTLGARRALLTRKSLLLFTDDLVLKLRRPRSVDGYDQSVMSVRYAMSVRERWIGRALNTGVYLDDCVLRTEPGSDKVILHRGPGDGEPIVLMRRLSDAERADRALAEASSEQALALLEPAMVKLALHHARAEHHGAPPFGDPTRPGKRFAAALAAVEPVLEQGERAQLEQDTGALLERLAPTFLHRVNERRIRTVHGEVRLEHMFLSGAGEVAIIDPNDGPDADRAIDTAEEIMAIALELDLAIGSASSDRVIETYASATADATLRKVTRFYKRLACLRRAADAVSELSEPELDAADARARARFFVQRALHI